MEESLRRALKTYYSAPEDASVTVKFKGWTAEDFAALKQYDDDHPVYTREEMLAREKRMKELALSS